MKNYNEMTIEEYNNVIQNLIENTEPANYKIYRFVLIQLIPSYPIRYDYYDKRKETESIIDTLPKNTKWSHKDFQPKRLRKLVKDFEKANNIL